MTSLCVIINKEHGEDWSCCNAQRGVRRRNTNLLRTACGSMEDVYLSYQLPKQEFNLNLIHNFIMNCVSVTALIVGNVFWIVTVGA